MSLLYLILKNVLVKNPKNVSMQLATIPTINIIIIAINLLFKNL